MNQDNRIEEFTDLNSWKSAHDLVLYIYTLTKKFPNSEKFGLTSQIQRAGVSITSNIAEGFSRNYYREKVQFYYQAHGSLTEVKNQLILSRDLNYIDNTDFNLITEKLIVSQKLLRGLIKKTKSLVKLTIH